MQSMIAIHEKISTIKYAGVESGPLQTHLDIILRYASELKRGNDALSDYKLLQYTLKSLPSEFTSLIQTISLTGHTSIQAVTPVLLEEEVRQRSILEGQRHEEHALKVYTEKLALAKAHDEQTAADAVKAYVATQQGSWSRRGGRGGRGSGRSSTSGGDWKKDVICYGCGNKGHISRDCRLSTKDQAKEKLRLAQVAYDSVAEDDNHPKVLLTKKATNGLRTDALFVDSGASRNLTSDRSSFITYTVLKEPIPIQLGDNSEIHAIGYGTSARHVKSLIGIQTMHFTRTLHAPKLAGSLLSVGQLTAPPGVTVEFQGTVCFIKLRGETLCEAMFKDSLYTLELADYSHAAAVGSPSVLKAKSPAPAGKRLDILTLHRRLGHLNLPDLRRLIVNLCQRWSMGWSWELRAMTWRFAERLRASRSQKEGGSGPLVF
jgi:hypothetical protein